MATNKKKTLSEVPLSSVVLATGIAAVATKYLDEQYFLIKDARLLAGFTGFAVKMKYHELTDWTVPDGLEVGCAFCCCCCCFKINPNKPKAAAEQWGGKEAIVFDDVSYTFNQWNEHCNQVARWAKSIGLKKGDVVAVMMENKPEHLFTTLGLAKLGVVGALINHNLREKPLLHCIRVCKAKALLFGIEVAEQVGTVVETIKADGISIHVQGGKSVSSLPASFGASHVDPLWGAMSKQPFPKSERAGVTYNHACMYIFTSGTTGLPKAAGMFVCLFVC